MNSIYRNLLFLSMTVFFFSQMQVQAQTYSNNQPYQYDLSDYLDLEAIATVFGESKTIDDFEYKLNDYRNQVSNLDLNNDGYVDYLRVIKQYNRNTHVILIQAVLGNSYYQDVASVVVGKDVYGRDYIQFIGDSYLYGNDYILEPVFQKRPKIVRWLWNEPNYVYVSKYYWGYYPTHFRLRPIIPVQHYFNHLKVFVNVHHHYYYTSKVLFPVYVDVIHSYRRNDYWKNHLDIRFEQRHKDYKNKGQFQHYKDKKKPDVKDKDVRHSDSYRRQNQQPAVRVPQREQPAVRTPQKEQPVVKPQKDNKTTPAPTRENRITVRPQQEKKTPQVNERKSTPTREVKPEAQKQKVEVSKKVETSKKVESTSNKSTPSGRSSNTERKPTTNTGGRR